MDNIPNITDAGGVTIPGGVIIIATATTTDSNTTNLTPTARGVITTEPVPHDAILRANTSGNGSSTYVEIIQNTHPITNGFP